MRHRKTVQKLSMKADHRKSVIRNLATTFALAGHLTTTTPKAKVLAGFYEHLISLAKRGDTQHAVRVAKQTLYTVPAQKAFVSKLKDFSGRSGFLRVTKAGFRKGDAAEISLVQYV